MASVSVTIQRVSNPGALVPRMIRGGIIGYELILWGILFLIMASVSVTIQRVSNPGPLVLRMRRGGNPWL